MILLKKAVRSMWDNKKAYVACIFLIMIGVFINDAMGSCSDIFTEARSKYYEEYRLADIFAKVKAMPTAALNAIERIDGVYEAAGRYVYDARVMIEGSDKPIILRITSVDSAYEGMPINGILVTGNDFNEPTDIMVDAAFMKAHDLKYGDNIRVIINRKEYGLNICGTGDSPEYAYAIKDITSILPDPKSFGYAYMPIESLWSFTGRSGFYNDVCISLEESASYESVKSPLEDELRKYGFISMFPQKDHPSVSLIEMELSTIGVVSSSVPLLFMGMAMIVLYLMLKRVIEQERTQIGVLKAFGYSNAAILIHYVFYGAVTGVIGGVLGYVYGSAALGPYVALFKTYFNLPTGTISVSADLAIRGMIISVSAGVLGGMLGAQRSLKLQPAESMRPETPKAEKFDILKKIPFLRMVLSSGGNMAVRSIVRNKMRSVVIVLSIMFAFGLMAVFSSMNLMIDHMLFSQYTMVQRYDAKIIFQTPIEYEAALTESYRIDGVTLAEGIMEIPVEIKNRNLKTGLNIIGLEKDSSLYKIYDNEKETSFTPPTEGILISDVLSDKLDAKKGDILYLSSPLLDRDVKLTVTQVVTQNLSQAAFMEINAMAEMFNLKKLATSAILKTNDTAVLTELIDEASNIAAIEDKSATLSNYQDLMAPYSFLYFVVWLMAVVVAFAIIYNTATITLSERRREYATLRVLGMQVTEVAAIMGFEYWVLCITGIILGLPFHNFLKQAMAAAMASDAFTFPTVTPVYAYVMSVAGCMASVFLANRSAVKQIRKFDMVEVLKERE